MPNPGCGPAAGFVAALAVLYQRQKKENGRLAPILWISQTLAACEAGQPYAPGLKAYGLDAERFLFVSARTVKDGCGSQKRRFRYRSSPWSFWKSAATLPVSP